MPPGKSRRTRGRGFTLIEILIVVTILGILAGLVLPHYFDATATAKASSLLTDIQMIRQRLQKYHIDHASQYPALDEMWINLISPTDADGDPGTEFGPYMMTAPVNPFTGGSACAAGNDADWQYDEIEGTLRAVVPAELIAELDLSPMDTVAGP